MTTLFFSVITSQCDICDDGSVSNHAASRQNSLRGILTAHALGMTWDFAGARQRTQSVRQPVLYSVLRGLELPGAQALQSLLVPRP